MIIGGTIYFHISIFIMNVLTSAKEVTFSPALVFYSRITKKPGDS